MRRFAAGLCVAAWVLGWAGLAIAEEPGHIQIKCEPGVQILLDGTLKGVTKADLGGLILQNVPAGRHLIKAIKEGSGAQEAEIRLDAGQVLVQEFKAFAPGAPVKADGPATAGAKVGTIEIQTLPVECTIDIPSAGLNAHRKTEAKVVLAKVPAGTHAARFSALGKTLDYRITLAPGATVRLMVNFLEGKITEQITAPDGSRLAFGPIDPSSIPLNPAPPKETRRPGDLTGPTPEEVVAAMNMKVYTAWPFDAAEAKRRQEETARALGEKVEKDVDLGGGVKLTLVLIPAGEFLMGSAETSEELHRMYVRFYKDLEPKWYDPEHPQHKVRITKPFWMGKYEVRQEQWEAVMGNNPSEFKGAKNPVERVSWNDIQGFLQKLNGRAGGGGFGLPTEAQWEYACRAGSGGQFSFGNDAAPLQGYGKYGGDGYAKTAPVGRFLPNGFGLHDMHGNVWEWCSDWFEERYYAASPIEDPQCTQAGQFRGVRNGGWIETPISCRSAYRRGNFPEARSTTGGLRVVRAVRTF